MATDDEQDLSSAETLRLSAGIVAAFVSNNRAAAADLPAIIETVHAAIGALSAPPAPQPDPQKPAVSIARSVQDDYLVCLEDGARLKMLKRYLRSRFGMSPEEYRRKWSLPHDYPMVAPSYARRRSDFAKTIGLGKKRG